MINDRREIVINSFADFPVKFLTSAYAETTPAAAASMNIEGFGRYLISGISNVIAGLSFAAYKQRISFDEADITLGTITGSNKSVFIKFRIKSSANTSNMQVFRERYGKDITVELVLDSSDTSLTVLAKLWNALKVNRKQDPLILNPIILSGATISGFYDNGDEFTDLETATDIYIDTVGDGDTVLSRIKSLTSIDLMDIELLDEFLEVVGITIYDDDQITKPGYASALITALPYTVTIPAYEGAGTFTQMQHIRIPNNINYGPYSPNNLQAVYKGTTYSVVRFMYTITRNDLGGGDVAGQVYTSRIPVTIYIKQVAANSDDAQDIMLFLNESADNSFLGYTARNSAGTVSSTATVATFNTALDSAYV